MVDLYYLIKKKLSEPTLSGKHRSVFFFGVSRNQKRAFESIVIMSAAGLVELAPMSPN